MSRPALPTRIQKPLPASLTPFQQRTQQLAAELERYSVRTALAWETVGRRALADLKAGDRTIRRA